jgi:hypothetical protein
MLYDPKLLDIEKEDDTGRYAVWYDEHFLGFARDEEEAYDWAINYAIGQATYGNEE